MSKADNLKDFLTDVADAIRLKKGSTDLINPQDFSAEIASISGGGGLEVIEMTGTTATIDPNKVYVWGMVESLDITLGASTDDSDFFAFRFRCSKPTMTSVTVNGATWADDTELDAQGKPVLDLGSWYQCEIKGGTSALYARLAHYIPFEDSNVEAVLLAKGVGDGLGVTYKDAAKLRSISTWFQNNTKITSFTEFVNFSGIITLGDSAFSGCTSLAEIALPASLMGTGKNAFRGCSSLAEITLPAGVTSIAAGAFNGCSSLAEITLPAGVTSIGGYAFHDCSSLAEITLPAGVTSIGYGAFSSTVIYGEFTFENLQTLDSRAFENTKVSKMKFPSLVSSEASSSYEGIFSYCTNLVLVDIGDKCTTIKSNSFGRFVGTNGNDITFIIRAITPPELADRLISTQWVKAKIGVIYVPDESVETYKTATNWSYYADIIKPLSEYTE